MRRLADGLGLPSATSSLSSDPARPPYAGPQPPGENSAPPMTFGAKIEKRPPPPTSSSSPRAAAAHAEGCELAVRGQAGQAVQRQQRIRAAANGAAQGFAVEPGGGRRGEWIDGPRLHQHLLQQRDAQLKVDPGVLPRDHAY